MPTVNITYFGEGMADDYTNGGVGECSVSKHFDILTYPRRLQPLRGMEADVLSDSKLGNIILGSNGIFYGVGTDPNNPTLGELYKKTGIGTGWTDFSTDQLSGAAVEYDFLVHFPEQTPVRKLYWASANLIMASDPADAGSSSDSEALTFTTIGQGIVHPKDKCLYFPYQTTSASLIYKIAVHATDPFGTVTPSAFSGTPNRYRSYCLSYLNDYLAIPMTTSTQGGFLRSVVGLWDRDTSLNVFTETIPWGEGTLKVLNNLNGDLIGISEFAGSSGSAQDTDKIQIKVYEGGAEPRVIKELIATRLTSTAPTCVLNYRVNFIHNNRLYFSANVVNGGTAPAYYGLWSVGRNKRGAWTVALERMATNTGTETGVIAAGMVGDFATMVHTAVGTITSAINGNDGDGGDYDATSVYETVVNPEMNEDDREKEKQLEGVYATYLPLPTNGSVTMQYRVDSSANGSWTTIFTETTNSETRTEKDKVFPAGTQFNPGVHYEFRLTSTGGAIITGFGYKYRTTSNLL